MEVAGCGHPPHQSQSFVHSLTNGDSVGVSVPVSRQVVAPPLGSHLADVDVTGCGCVFACLLHGAAPLTSKQSCSFIADEGNACSFCCSLTGAAKLQQRAEGRTVLVKGGATCW